MPQHDVPGGEDLSAQRVLPVPAGGLDFDLADHDLDRAVQQLVLVLHVPVERHGLDAELLAEPAHAQGIDAAAIGEVHGRSKDPLPGEGRATFRGGDGFGHLTSVRRTPTFTP